MVRCDREVEFAPGSREDRTGATSEVYDRRASLNGGQLTPNNVDLSMVDPAKKVLKFPAAVIV